MHAASISNILLWRGFVLSIWHYVEHNLEIQELPVSVESYGQDEECQIFLWQSKLKALFSFEHKGPNGILCGGSNEQILSLRIENTEMGI